MVRSEIVDPTQVQLLHVFNRCVRRAFICGFDAVSKKDYSHRKDWLQARMEYLIGIFAFDLATFAIMSNHFHLVLRSRPDIAAGWPDEEVAIRNMRLQGKRWFHSDGTMRKTAAAEIQRIVNDPAELQRIRHKLSNVSSLMSYFDENIAKRANREDKVKGAFWEGVFGCELLNTVADLLACMVYVDLNPIRAMIAETLEESEYTGAFERINELRRQLAMGQIADPDSPDRIGDLISEVGSQMDQRDAAGAVAPLLTETSASSSSSSSSDQATAVPTATSASLSSDEAEPASDREPSGTVGGLRLSRTLDWEREGAGRIGWMAPIEIEARGSGLDLEPSVRRPSRKGFLPISLLKYLEIVEWAGRQQRADKRGSVPSSLAPIFQRLGFDSTGFLAAMLAFSTNDSYFAATERQGKPNRTFAAA